MANRYCSPASVAPSPAQGVPLGDQVHHDHGHRTRSARDHPRPATEDCCHDAHDEGAIEPDHRRNAGYESKGYRFRDQGEGHDQAGKDVVLDRALAVFYEFVFQAAVLCRSERVRTPASCGKKKEGPDPKWIGGPLEVLGLRAGKTARRSTVQKLQKGEDLSNRGVRVRGLNFRTGHVFPSFPRHNGAWRSPVAHLLWEQGVPGSNPGAPIRKRAADLTQVGGPFFMALSRRRPDCGAPRAPPARSAANRRFDVSPPQRPPVSRNA